MVKYTPSEPQRIAHQFLTTHPDTFLLMGMGLGKTSTILNYMDGLLTSGRSKGALVVAPLRVKNLTWPSEVAKYRDFSWMRVADLATEQGQKAFRRGSADLYLVNWDRLTLVAKLLASKSSGLTPYDTVIFDESTKGKSNDSKRAATYHKYCPRVERQIAMTGTPAPNSLIDLWGQMRLVDGGKRLGVSFDAFKQRFFEPVDYRGYRWVPQAEAEQRIYKRISDVTLTLKSSQYLDLPDAVLHDVDVPLPKTYVKQYAQFERDLVTQIRGQNINAVNSAALVTKLLQFTSGAIYDDDRIAHVLHDLKIQALKERLKEIGAPTLLMYGYQHEKNRLRAEFPRAVFMSDAKTASAQQEQMDRWNAGKIPLLIAHPASMSHGLNMQDGGCHIVWLTLTYNREYYEQAIGRLYRRGQDAVVHVHRLLCPETVDWAVVEALRGKADTEGALLAALQNLEAFRAAGGIVELDDDDWQDILGDLF
jgi:SNF2 family DNA or RNA helicase